MAPFIVHFLVAEQVWPALPARCRPYYGQFCFGCVAPDVDKVSAELSQKDTHFFDRTTAYELMASHRSAAFIQQQANFLYHPVQQLPPDEQAFALGYLCHLCVDEVSKYMWQRSTWRAFTRTGPGPAFAALDEYAKTQMNNYPAVTQVVAELALPRLIPAIGPADWQAFHGGVLNFLRAGTTEQEFLALVDMFDRLPASSREQQVTAFRANISAARERVGVFQLHKMIVSGKDRTLQRMTELLTQRPALPELPKIP